MATEPKDATPDPYVYPHISPFVGHKLRTLLIGIPATVKVEFLSCGHCGALAFAINDTRVTNHKCVGSWTTVRTENVRVLQLLDVILSLREKRCEPKS